MSQANQASRERQYAWGVCGFLLAAVWLIYGQTLAFDPMTFDDGLFIYNNPEVCAGLTADGARWAFTKGPLGEWYPLSMLSHMLDCELFGLAPWGHHLTNVLLHAATTIGLFLVLRQMTGELWLSALVATLFGVHPQHVESVAWLSERRDVLNGLFFVLTLAAYQSYLCHGRTAGRYLPVVFALGLSLLAKPTTVAMPPLLLVLDYWPLRRFGLADESTVAAPQLPRQSFWRLAAEKLPLLALALAAAVMTLMTHAKTTKPTTQRLIDRLENAPVAQVTYLRQFFWPADLAPFYPFPAAGYPAWKVLAAVVLLAAVTAAAIVLRRTRPYLIVGWLWFLGFMVPVMGVVNVQDHAMADRYMYLPSIGLAIALVWGIAAWGAALQVGRQLLAGGAALAVGLYISVAVWQTSYWHNDLTLWQRAAAMSEDNQKVEIGLAGALQRAHRLDEAIDHYQRALSWLMWSDLVNHFGTALAEKGDLDQAATQFRRAIELDPNSIEPEVNLGTTLEKRGQLDEAAAHFRRAIELNSRLFVPHFHLANLLLKQEKFEEAASEFQRTIEAAPNFEIAYLGLAATCVARGEIDRAIDQYRAALKIAPDDPVARAELERLLQLKSQSTRP